MLSSPSSLLRPALGLLSVAAIALPVVGCGSDSSSPSSSGGVDPASAIPATAPVYVEGTVRAEGDTKDAVQAVAKKLLRTDDPGGELVKLLDKELADENLSFAKDIDPWLGDRIGVGITGVKQSGVDAVVSAAVKDGDKAQDFLDKESKGNEVREYGGEKYRFDAKDDSAVALLDDTMLIGTEPGVKAAIDAAKGTSLGDSDTFKKAKDEVGDDGVGLFYLDPERALDLATQAGGSQAEQLGMLRGALTGSGVKAVVASLDVEEDALRIDAASVGGKAPAAGSGDAAGAVAAAPAGSWLAFGIGDVGGTVQKAIDQLGKSGGLGGVDPATLLSQLESQIGINLQKDLLAWMGDATISVHGSSTADLGGALVVTSKDPAASKSVVAKLRRLADQAGAPTTDARDLDEGFAISQQGVTAEIGVKGDTFVVAVGKDAVAQALSGGDRLADSAPYKEAVEALGDDTKPSFFLDVAQVVKLLEGVAGSDPDFAKAKPTLEAFGALAAGSKRDGDVQRFKLGVKIK